MNSFGAVKSVAKLVFAIGLTSLLVLNVIVVIREQPLNKGNLAAGLEEKKIFSVFDGESHHFMNFYRFE